MKKIFLSLIAVLSFQVGAEIVSLPPSVSTVDEIINEFRNIFVTKINELGKNFISNLSDKTILFTNSTNLQCNGVSIAQGEAVSKIQYNFKKEGNELVEKSIYTGCNNQISLMEDVITRGINLAPLKYDDFIKGKRDFDLNNDQTYRLYRLSNSDNEEIFKMLIEKNGNSKIVELYILGQKFLSMNYDFQEISTRVVLTYYSYKASYSRKYSSWSFNSNFASFRNTVSVTKGQFNQTSYYDTYGAPLSQTEYLSQFDAKILSGAIARIRNIVDYHNYYFPTTKVIQTGSANQRLKEELRITFNRLQNNTELSLVKKQIQDYIDAAEKGFIIDNRPKE